MSAALIWIGIPIIVGIILIGIQKMKILVVVFGSLIAFLLAGIAWRFPIGEAISLGPWVINIDEQISVGGLQFILGNSDRSMVTLFYGVFVFLSVGSLSARAHRHFVPYGLIVIGLLTSILAVEPFFYAALILAVVVLINIFILVSPGQDENKGVLRFLVFQVIGTQLILFGGWLLNESALTSGDIVSITRASVILGLGFVFIFSIFPLYVWLPKTLQDIHPYAGVFVFSMVYGISSIFFLEFLLRYPWLHEVADLNEILRFVGVFMVGTGGVWAAFQKHLGRILGYAMVIEIGYALISIGISNSEFYYAMLPPRLLSLAVWGLGLSIISQFTPDLRFSTVQGFARHFPIAAAGVLFAEFSIAGLPLLAGFPALLEIWQRLSFTSPLSTIWAFLGSVGLLAGSLRSFAVLVMGSETTRTDKKQSLSSKILIIMGVAGLFLMGLFPHWFSSIILGMAGGFPLP